MSAWHRAHCVLKLGPQSQSRVSAFARWTPERYLERVPRAREVIQGVRRQNAAARAEICDVEPRRYDSHSESCVRRMKQLILLAKDRVNIMRTAMTFP